MPTAAENRQAGLAAIASGQMAPIPSPNNAKAADAPANPPTFPQSPSPYLRSPLPSALVTQPDTTRTFQNTALPQSRIAPIPASSSPVSGAQAQSQTIIVNEGGGGNGLILYVNNVKAPNQNIANFVGVGITISANAQGQITFTSSGGDGLTHGTTPWEIDPSSVIMDEDFFTAQIATFNGNTGTGPYGGGWTLQGTGVYIGQSAWGSLFGGLGGSVSWENNGTAHNAAGLFPPSVVPNSGSQNTNGFALLENGSWKSTHIFKLDNAFGNGSLVTQFLLPKKSLYVGFASTWLSATLGNATWHDARPYSFLGVRYDTSTSVFAANTTTVGTVNNGNGGTAGIYTFATAQTVAPGLIGQTLQVGKTSIQSANATTTSASSLTSGTFNTAATDAILVYVRWINSTGQTISSISDLGGNPWHLLGTFNNLTNTAVSIYYVQNAGLHASNTVTVNFSAAMSNAQMQVYDIAGAVTTGTLVDVDPNNFNNGSVTTLTTSVTTTNADDVIFAFATVGNTSGIGFTAPSGWVATTVSTTMASSYNPVAAIQTGLGVTYTITPGTNLQITAVAVKMINAPVTSGECIYIDTSKVAIAGATGGNNPGIVQSLTTPPNDSFFTFEYVNNYQGGVRNNLQGQTFVTTIAPQQGFVYRLDMVGTAAGSVTMTLSGYNPNTGVTLTPSTTTFSSLPKTTYLMQFSGSTSGASYTVNNGAAGIEGIANLGNPLNTVAANSEGFPFGGGSIVTIAGMGVTYLDGTFTLSDTYPLNMLVVFDTVGANTSGSTPNGATVTGYPILVPCFIYGNDDSASPTGSQARIYCDYFGLAVNPNLGASAPGSPNSLFARFF